MLEHLLPMEFPYLEIKSSVISDEKFQCEIRVKISNKNDFDTWLNQFKAITNTSWILRDSVPPGKSLYNLSRNYLCQHSSYRKTKEGSKNKNCLASLNVRIKRNTKFIRCRDPFVKDGYFTIIKINCMHSHKLNAAETLKWLPRSKETVKTFIDLFDSGMTPAAAKRYHESLLSTESPELLADRRINPPIRWIYHMHHKWRTKKLSGLNSEPNFKRCLENKVKNETSICAVPRETWQLIKLTRKENPLDNDDLMQDESVPVTDLSYEVEVPMTDFSYEVEVPMTDSSYEVKINQDKEEKKLLQIRDASSDEDCLPIPKKSMKYVESPENTFGRFVASEMKALKENYPLYVHAKKKILRVLINADLRNYSK